MRPCLFCGTLTYLECGCGAACCGCRPVPCPICIRVAQFYVQDRMARRLRLCLDDPDLPRQNILVLPSAVEASYETEPIKQF